MQFQRGLSLQVGALSKLHPFPPPRQRRKGQEAEERHAPHLIICPFTLLSLHLPPGKGRPQVKSK